MKYNKGFTLLELLVVIAVIGILTSVVLASMSQSREKGADGGIKEEMANVRTQAEVYYHTHSNVYTGMCTSMGQNGVKPLLDKVSEYAGTAATCFESATKWAAAVQLKSQATTTYFCVDSDGKAISTLTALSGVTCQ